MLLSPEDYIDSQTLARLCTDQIHLEQYLDFLYNRMFRQTLLCHADVRLDYSLRPEAVTRFWVSSSAKPVPPAEGKAPAEGKPADGKAPAKAQEFRG